MRVRPSYPLSRLDYDLPPELIAQQPLPARSASRLLYVRVRDGVLADHSFAELPALLPPASLVVLNESRVIPARVLGARAANAGQGGGRVEVLYLRYLQDGVCEAVVGSNARLGASERITLPGGWSCELLHGKALDGVPVRYLQPDGTPAELGALLAYLEAQGRPPLPPYIKRGVPRETDIYDVGNDKQRYQTVYARQDGSAAAPTAGLHFDAAMLARLEADGHALARVALHVGLGTFAPVRAADLRDHEMHEEAYSVAPEAAVAYRAARAGGRSVLAVGTTSLRVLHTLAGGAAGDGRDVSRPYEGGGMPHGELAGMTRAFIYPGHGTDACELLLTNFHLPKSTLLALVYAFGGEDLLRRAYAHAIAQRYRFFSYGDCMLIDRRG